jgi:hypothetical protein
MRVGSAIGADVKHIGVFDAGTAASVIIRSEKRSEIGHIK